MGRAVRRGSGFGKPALTHQEVTHQGGGLQEVNIKHQRKVLKVKGRLGRKSGGQGLIWERMNKGPDLRVKPGQGGFSDQPKHPKCLFKCGSLLPEFITADPAEWLFP